MANITRHRKLFKKLGVYIDFKTKGNRSANQREKIISEIAETIAMQKIYWNDLTCKHWSFDYKLPCGVWVENVYWNNELDTVHCMVY